MGGDRGLEFTNKLMQQYCKTNGMIYTPNYNYSHAAFVERANRTFQKILYAWMTENETHAYLPHLRQLTQLYNSRHNRMIGMTPDEAEDRSNHLDVRKNLEKQYAAFVRARKARPPQFEAGDVVRVAKSKGHFSRSYEEQFQQEMFKVIKINTRLPIPTYTLSDYLGEEEIKGNFYGFEITHVRTENFRIEHVIRKRTTKGRKEYLVRWKGFSSKHDSWVQENEIVRTF